MERKIFLADCLLAVVYRRHFLGPNCRGDFLYPILLFWDAAGAQPFIRFGAGHLSALRCGRGLAQRERSSVPALAHCPCCRENRRLSLARGNCYETDGSSTVTTAERILFERENNGPWKFRIQLGPDGKCDGKPYQKLIAASLKERAEKLYGAPL